MINKNEFKYELGHDQLKNLIQEIKAVKAFNYKQFRKLTLITTQIIENRPENGDILVDLVREIQGFNYKQYRKLNYIINQMMLVIDPNWKPISKPPKEIIIKKEVKNDLDNESTETINT